MTYYIEPEVTHIDQQLHTTLVSSDKSTTSTQADIGMKPYTMTWT